MSQLLQPGSLDPKDLNSATAKWEEKGGIHEKPSAKLLPEHIKSCILTEMTPEMTQSPLREDLVLNTAKLCDYDGVREEIQCYRENRQNPERGPFREGQTPQSIRQTTTRWSRERSER